MHQAVTQVGPVHSGTGDPAGGTRPGTWCDLGGRSDDGDTTTGGDVAEPSFGGARAGIIPDNAPPEQHARCSGAGGVAGKRRGGLASPPGAGAAGRAGRRGGGSASRLGRGQGARKGSTTSRKSWVFSIMVQWPQLARTCRRASGGRSMSWAGHTRQGWT